MEHPARQEPAGDGGETAALSWSAAKSGRFWVNEGFTQIYRGKENGLEAHQHATQSTNALTLWTCQQQRSSAYKIPIPSANAAGSQTAGLGTAPGSTWSTGSQHVLLTASHCSALLLSCHKLEVPRGSPGTTDLITKINSPGLLFVVHQVNMAAVRVNNAKQGEKKGRVLSFPTLVSLFCCLASLLKLDADKIK